MSRLAGGEFLREALRLDRLGKEAAAIPLYQKALRLGLNKNLQRDALICLASSLRNVGQAQKALTIIRRADRLFPTDPVIRLFSALVYWDVDQRAAALRLLAQTFLQQSRDRRLIPYRSVLLRKFRRL